MLKTVISLAAALFIYPITLLADSETTYGVPFAADGLTNLNVGGVLGKFAYRFRAEHSGTVSEALINVVVSMCPNRPGYSAGDGGDLIVRLHEDDGSGERPGEVLASSLISDPLNVGSTGSRVEFDPPATLRAGQLYYLVFSNPVPEYPDNYVSLNTLVAGPAIPDGPVDSDMATFFCNSESGSICVETGEPGSTSSESWSLDPLGRIPIFTIRYDGSDARQGQGYRHAAEPSRLQAISGSNLVRQIFTLDGCSREVTDINVRLRRRDAAGDPNTRSPLLIRLCVGSEPCRPGTIVVSGQIGADRVPTDEHDWVTLMLDQPQRLQSRTTYNVELSSEDDPGYELFPIQQGSSVPGCHCLANCPETDPARTGFTNTSNRGLAGVFDDGYLEVSADGGANWEDNCCEDFQLYLTVSSIVVGSGAPASLVLRDDFENFDLRVCDL